MVGRRLALHPGFSLVEAIVALTLLALGLLGALASQVMSARLLREAEARAGAVDLASTILDSLLAVPVPTSGERHEAGYDAEWSVAAGDGSSRIEVRIQYDAGTARRELRFESLHAPPPPRLRRAR